MSTCTHRTQWTKWTQKKHKHKSTTKQTKFGGKSTEIQCGFICRNEEFTVYSLLVRSLYIFCRFPFLLISLFSVPVYLHMCARIRTYLPLSFRFFNELPPKLLPDAKKAHRRCQRVCLCVWERGRVRVFPLCFVYVCSVRCAVHYVGWSCVSEVTASEVLSRVCARSRTSSPDWFFSIFSCESSVECACVHRRRRLTRWSNNKKKKRKTISTTATYRLLIHTQYMCQENTAASRSMYFTYVWRRQTFANTQTKNENFLKFQNSKKENFCRYCCGCWCCCGLRRFFSNSS